MLGSGWMVKSCLRNSHNQVEKLPVKIRNQINTGHLVISLLQAASSRVACWWGIIATGSHPDGGFQPTYWENSMVICKQSGRLPNLDIGQTNQGWSLSGPGSYQCGGDHYRGYYWRHSGLWLPCSCQSLWSPGPWAWQSRVRTLNFRRANFCLLKELLDEISRWNLLISRWETVQQNKWTQPSWHLFKDNFLQAWELSIIQN